MIALIHATKNLPGYNYFKPLGLGYLKSYSKREIPSVEVRMFDDIDVLIHSKPDCVGISSSTEDFAVAQEYISKVRSNLNCPILLGGVHISLLPETLPDGVIACLGEGEETFVDLVKLIVKNHKIESKMLSKIQGLAYWDENHRLVRTEQRELITDMDNIPLPDRDFLGIKPYKNDTLYMFTSRGCPYSCKFCVSRVHWGKYREFSADYVIREMEELINKYGVKTISFFDDLFIVNRKRLSVISNKFKEKGFIVNTVCAVRANLVDDELCDLLKNINVNEVTFGAESFSEPVLKELKKGSVTAAQNQHALDVLHKNGIRANMSIIIDAPEETREDLLITWKAIFNNLRSGKVNKVGWGLLRPYPGCDYWDLAVKKGIVSVNMDWDVFKNWNSFHLNDNIERNEVDKIIDEWETKCYLVNLHFRDEAQSKYANEETIFVYKYDLIEDICTRTNKDESDVFVEKKYKDFLIRADQYELIVGSGWYNEEQAQRWRWIDKKATFCIPSTVKEVADYLNLIFYVANNELFKKQELKVTLKIEDIQNSINVSQKGEYRLSVKIPFVPRLTKFYDCEIECNNSFCPAQLGDSSDSRRLSLVVSRLELAKSDPLNIIRVLKITEESKN